MSTSAKTGAPPAQGGEAIGDRLLFFTALAALVVVPIYFNSSSLNSFARDKTALLRCLALLLAGGWALRMLPWLLGSVLGRNGNAQRPRWLPAITSEGVIVVALATFLLLLQAAATATSATPRISLIGDYTRMQGLYTAGAYFVVFMTLVSVVRDGDRLNQLVDAILLASVPIALYGLLQRYGIDPITREGTPRSPVISTMGNEIFVGSYLVMAAPLVLHRLIAALGGISARRPSRMALASGALVLLLLVSGSWWLSLYAGVATTIAAVVACICLQLVKSWRGAGAAVGYVTLLSVQLACIAFSESRGPFLGLLAGFGLFGLLCCIIYGGRRALLTLVLAASLLLACLIAINIPGSPLSFVGDLPVIGRLTRILEVEGSAQVRLLIWDAVAELMASEPWRLIIGHGPDTIRLALQPHYDPGLATLSNPDELPDRAHNDSLDWLMTAGLAGLATYGALLTAVFLLLLRTIGVVSASRARSRLTAALVLSVVLLAVAGRMIAGSWQFLGLALPLGLIVGLCGYLTVWAAARAGRERQQDAGDGRTVLLSAALLSALVAHLIETHVGIATAASRLMFWALCGLAVAAAGMRSRQGDVAVQERDPVTSSHTSSALFAVVFLIALTLGFDFGRAGSDDTGLLYFAGLVALTFAVLVPIVLSEPGVTRQQAGALVLERLSFFGALYLAGLLAAQFGSSDFLRGFEPKLSGFVLYVGLVVAVIAATTIESSWQATLKLQYRAVSIVSAAVLALAPLWFAWSFDAKLVRADEAAKVGWLAERNHEAAAAIAAYRDAIELSPGEDRYHGLLGAALVRQAARAGNAAERERLLLAAEAAFQMARALSPLDVEHAISLARLHTAAARFATSEAQKEHHLEEASAAYAWATDRVPMRPALWTEWGDIAAAQKDFDAATERYERAHDLQNRR